MSKRRLCILGGCGGIGRSLVKSIAAGYDVAVMQLAAALVAIRRPGMLAIKIDGSDEASVTDGLDMLGGRWGALDGFVNRREAFFGGTPADEFDVTTKRQSPDHPRDLRLSSGRHRAVQ